MKFGVWTRKERAFLEGRTQERDGSLNEPEGGPSTASMYNPADAIYDGSLKLLNMPNDDLSHSVITTNTKGNSVLLVKTNDIYSIGFFNSKLQTETYQNHPKETVFIKYLETVTKLGPIFRVNFVNAHPPVNEEVAGEIIDYETLFIVPQTTSFGKSKVNSDIKYLNSL